MTTHIKDNHRLTILRVIGFYQKMLVAGSPELFAADLVGVLGYESAIEYLENHEGLGDGLVLFAKNSLAIEDAQKKITQSRKSISAIQEIVDHLSSLPPEP